MKPSSTTRPRIRQTGYALLLMVVALMGLGGVVMSSFTEGAKQETEHQRYLHNQRVLREAKQALLQYAYNYPVKNPLRGPGRLPCPDMNNDGSPDPSFNCISGTAMVGRFPWKDPDMNFYYARDASGASLWYAVSNNFANTISPANLDVINSDTTGTISIEDRSGAILYDGSANNGVAAIIIAPGPAIDRGGVKQDRAADPVDPANYLDLFGTIDNADFVNGTTDGFVTGPIFNPVDGSLAVNDQMIVITAAEVIAMAEKATLQAYREALEVYLNRPGFGRYPWLDPYDSADGLATYDAQINPAPPAPIIGRVPSHFGRYFAVSGNDSLSFLTEMKMEVQVVGGHTFGSGSPAANAYFKADGTLVTPLNNGDTLTGWAWDGHPADPTLPMDGIWEACPYVTGTEDDCNQDAAGNFIGGTSSIAWLKVRKVTFNVNGPSSPIEYIITDRTAAPVAYIPPNPASHAYVEAAYNGPLYISNLSWSQDDNFKISHSEDPPGNTGNWTYTPGVEDVTVGVRYYPELPRWVWANGWHDMLQVAYSSEVRPGGDNVCTPGVDCLTLQDVGGVTNNKRALLVLSGGVGDFDPLDTDLTDAGGGPNYYADDLSLIFEGENNNLDEVFDNRPTAGLANDVILQLE
ncbi:MAG TPA: hypothetical protein VMZ32_09780 [Gammaproteobacteria bacterium]|nr:hypothetical protein [Gammaproteobacteria bacterium]